MGGHKTSIGRPLRVMATGETMRLFTRIGAVAASAALGGATLVGGAGVAVAQGQPEPVFDSPSVLTVSGSGTGTVLHYENLSERPLSCYAYAGEPTLIGELYEAMKNDPSSTGEMDPEIQAALEAATEDGTVGSFMGGGNSGETVEIPASTGPGISPAGVLTDDSFEPRALSMCMLSAGPDSYMEVEISEPVDGGGDGTGDDGTGDDGTGDDGSGDDDTGDAPSFEEIIQQVIEAIDVFGSLSPAVE